MEKLLSQEEIDALLQGIEQGKVDTSPGQSDESGVLPFDFADQDRIIRGRMPILDILNTQFARLFRNSLSLALRKALDITSQPMQMMKFGEFTRTLAMPSSLHVFKMDPLRGHALLALDSKLVFALVDIFLGGSGRTNYRIEGRDFTAIESRLIQKVVALIFSDLQKAWQTVHPLSIQHIRSEINPQFVSIVSPSDLVITAGFELDLEQLTGLINLCIPYSSVEPIKARLSSGYQREDLEVDVGWVERFLERLHRAEVEVAVELGKSFITPQNLLQLKVGDIVPLEKTVAELLTARVQGVPKFLGKPGVYGSNQAFQVEKMILAHQENF